MLKHHQLVSLVQRDLKVYYLATKRSISYRTYLEHFYSAVDKGPNGPVISAKGHIGIETS